MTRRSSLPPRALERTLAFQAGTWTPPEPRAACTVLLVRDGRAPDGTPQVETFLLRRAETMAFAARMHVFPGGRVDPIDAQTVVDLGWDDAERARQAARATWPVERLDELWACAVREVSEEVGLAMAPAAPDGTVRIDPQHLPLIAHMITPEIEERRYSVRFFAHAVDDAEQVQLSTTEAVDGFWISPAEALRRHDAGELAMLTPTVLRLREMALHSSSADYLEAARTFEVRPLMPRPVVADDGAVTWLVLDAATGEVLDQEAVGPGATESDGQPLVVELP